MPEKMTKAVFCRKAIHIDELKELYGQLDGDDFQVEKIVEISREAFHTFSTELYEYYRVFYDERESMIYDDESKLFHCLLVTTPDRKEGVLVETEGYAYARYSAYVPDCAKLDLKQARMVEKADMSHELPDQYFHNDWKIRKEAEQSERQVR